MFIAARLFATVVVVGASHHAALAQIRAPLKPGLWEVTHTHEMGGQKMPDMNEHLKNLPPETRRRMEEQMRARGVEMGSGGPMKICLNEETLARDDWASGGDRRCKTEVLSRTASVWKWRSTCDGEARSSAEGETRFRGDSGYRTVVDMTMQRHGQPQQMHMEMQGKWLSADCGQLKPFLPPDAGRTGKP